MSTPPVTTPDPQDHAATNPSPSQSLPLGWVETTLGEATGYGQTKKAEPHEIPADAWVLELEDIEKDTSKIIARATFSERESKSTKNRFSAGDVLYGKLRPYLNKVVLADANGFCTTEIIPIRQTEHNDSRFIFYWLKHPEFIKYVTTVSHGMNMPRLGTEAGQQAPFILAPLPEQKRIADKLDTLLGRIEIARKRLERVPKLLKTFRQSVLSAAVSGELTREWRGGGDAEWDKVTVGDLLESLRNGVSNKPNEDSAGFPILKISSVRPFRVSTEKGRFVDISSDEFTKFNLKLGDLLVTRYNGSLELVGVAGIVRDSELENFTYPDKLMRLRVNQNILSNFLEISLNSPKSRQVIEGIAKTTSGQTGISGKDLKELEISLPPLPEQAEIVRRVEALFALADGVEARYAAGLAAFDSLTPALLQKAFRGELLPQDPADESASVLLERIRAVRAAGGVGARRGRGASKAKAEAGAATPTEATGKRRGRPRKDTGDTQPPTIMRAEGTRQTSLFEE